MDGHVNVQPVEQIFCRRPEAVSYDHEHHIVDQTMMENGPPCLLRYPRLFFRTINGYFTILLRASARIGVRRPSLMQLRAPCLTPRYETC